MNKLNLSQMRLRTQEDRSPAALKEVSNQEIAIIGIHAHFPMARDKDAFWQNIVNGISCVSAFPANRRLDADRYLRFSNKGGEPVDYLNGSFLDDIDKFDCHFFHIPPKEASLMSPQQRLFLETAWNVIEDAGYAPSALHGSNVGVYVGHIADVEGYQYGEMIRDTDPSVFSSAMPGNLSSIIPSRISYLLNLKGPSLSVDTACSSSLVAVELACEALRRGDCEMAIAGAVRVNLLPVDAAHEKLGIESTDDETRAFDQAADGSGTGEGAAAVLLKPLYKAIRDGDPIYCVIKGSATNQDGASMGITAPNPAAQTEVMIKAWKAAGIDPASLTYIETHGTGTKLGDPIEAEGIHNAFAKFTTKKQFCAIGSVKTNIGHLYDCAGLAGLIKAALALTHRTIPPSLHFNRPNKHIPFVDSPFYVNAKSKAWEIEEGHRRCGVSSFGLSGTNCHIVLEEYPESPRREADPEEAQLFPLSAKTEAALQLQLQQFERYLAKGGGPAFRDLCYTASVGRDHHAVRLAVLAHGIEDLGMKLRQLVETPRGQFAAPWLIADDSPQDNGMNQAAGQSEGHARTEDLLAIGRQYVTGSKMDWEALYSGTSARKVNLPGYAFDRGRCWIQIPESRQENERDPLFYGLDWVEEEREAQPSAVLQGETMMVMGEWTELTQALQDEGVRCIRVERGNRYEQLGPLHYLIGDKGEDYEQLIASIKPLGMTRIIHLFAFKNACEGNGFEALQETQNVGVYSLFHLTQALLNQRAGNQVEIVVVADQVYQVTGTEKELKPGHSPMFGLGKVIGIEYPHLDCRAIDLDEGAGTLDILQELCRPKQTYQIAFRDGKRYAEKLNAKRLDQADGQPVAVREDGVYVITGGAGNLGLLTAQHLASKGKVRIALLNRTPFPDAKQWDGLLAEDGDAELKAKIEMMKAMTASGATLEHIAVDVTSLDDMNDVMSRLRRTYRTINGVIHAAGIAGAGFLIRKDREAFRQVMGPKVLGSWILDQVTMQDELDFFVLYSSGVAISGEMGQSDYTAANCYLDAFADYRTRQGKPTTSINWVVWEGARMGEGTSRKIDGIFKALRASEALRALDTVLAHSIPRILVGQLNTFDRKGLELFSKESTVHLPDELQRLISAAAPQPAVGTPAARHREAGIGKGISQSRPDVEQTLSRLFYEVLGYEEISIHDSFFELGGDSVQLHRLHRLVDREFEGRTSIADLFAYSSIARLAGFLAQSEPKAQTGSEAAAATSTAAKDDIAIIGMSALFPGASDPQRFWENIENGVDCIGPIPEDRRTYLDQYLAFTGQDRDGHPGYIDCGYVDGADEFDYRFFKLSPKEANLTDPCQRLFMQTAWNAIEDAGYGGEKLRGSRTGIYIGHASVIRDSYQKLLTDIDPVMMSDSVVGNVSAMIPTRIAHLLDLKGPTMIVDTACSSSLTAAHLACNAIRSGDCDTALVGGIKLFLLPFNHDYYKIGIESKDGKTRAFDAHSDGSGLGEGTAVVVLKSLSKALADGDHIHAVIKGSALNQDGQSMGITAPNPIAQTDVIIRAWEKAGIHPESIAYIETHGTGTELGDPIEISGLKHAFERYTDKKQFCAIGSVKSNIGHLNEGAGMASIIKAVFALKNRVIPPSLYFQTPNAKIDFSGSPLFVNATKRKWQQEQADQPMRCAISSFGLSGTNCHMVLEEYRAPAAAAPIAPLDPNSPWILTLSAASRGSLQRLVKRYAAGMSAFSSAAIASICYTANTGRGHYPHRLALQITDLDDLRQKLKLLASQQDAAPQPLEGIFAGTHRVVSDSRSIRASEDITESRKRELTSEAEAAVSRYLETAELDSDAICRLYVLGADIPWDRLYGGQTYVKMPLPVYPFEKSKCWVQIPKPQLTAAPVNEDRIASAIAASKPIGYTMRWVEQERADAPAAGGNAGGILLIQDERGIAAQLADRLRRLGRQVETVDMPHFNRAIDDLEQEADMIRQLKDTLMGFADGGLAQIIHCGTIAPVGKSITSFEDLEKSQQRGAAGLLLLVKAWSACGFSDETELVLVSECVNRVSGAESRLCPENASLFGLGQVIPREHPTLKCRSIDIDQETGIDELLSEIAVGSPARCAAFRGGVRYVEMFDACSESEQLQGMPPAVEEGSVYLITGGLGAIGLETAKWLAGKGNVKLALVGRSIIPERRQWDAILASADDPKTCSIIQAVREIEAKGSSVLLYSADVANPDETAGLLDAIRREGAIKGIVHGAGIARTEPMIDKPLGAFEQVMRAKVYGTWLLDRFTQEDKLDFFVMYSSVATMFETGYQSDYIAANAYLDAFASLPSHDGRRRLTVNWTTWRDIGMAANQSFQSDTIFLTVDAVRAMGLLEQAWAGSLNRILLGELNAESKMALWLDNYAVLLSERVMASLEPLRRKHKATASRAAGLQHSSPVKLLGDEQHVRGKEVMTVAEACKEVLGVAEVDLYENFFEMGADSLIIRQIYQKLSKLYPGMLMVTDLFEYPTVHKLSVYIQSKLETQEAAAGLANDAAANRGSSAEERLNWIFEKLDDGELNVDEALSKLGSKRR